jgi:hypothetical protein
MLARLSAQLHHERGVQPGSLLPPHRPGPRRRRGAASRRSSAARSAEPEEVHLAGRADGQAGQGRRVHPRAPDRHPALQASATSGKAAWARARATRATRSGGEEGEGDGKGKAGQGEGQHALEVEVTLDELAAILGEELQLPNIEPKGKSKIVDHKDKYTGIRHVGPRVAAHFKRTFKQALKRQIASGTYNPEPRSSSRSRDDMRYRSWKTANLPESPTRSSST